MNDSDRYPKKLPPDDFSKTTPSIKIPREDLPPPREDFSNDWEKTNYNYAPKQSPPADDWGKTAHNINVPRNQPNEDFGKTFAPGNQPRESDWGVTQANINLPRDDFQQEDFGGARRSENNATMPYFQLPEAERAKYQNIPPTPSEAAAVEVAKQKEKKGKIPAWLWASAGLTAMFIFAAVILLAVYLFDRNPGFDLVVKGSQPGSEILIDNTRWGYSSPDGSVKLPNLKAGERTITVKKTGFSDFSQPVKGSDGETREVTVQQPAIASVAPPVDNTCKDFKPGEETKAAKCANDALDKLGDDFSVQDLLNAMNIYIIKFDVSKYDIKDQDKPFLQKATGLMKKLAAKTPNVKIEVGGHTDSDGTDAKNQVLSENRAKAVHDILISDGANPNMLETRGYGSKVKKADNDTPEHKFQNRRIEYKAVMASS